MNEARRTGKEKGWDKWKRGREGKKGIGKGGMGMKGEENWSSGRKVGQEGRAEEARKMERRNEEGWDKWKRGREREIGVGKGGMGMEREKTWSSGRKVEQEEKEDAARKIEEGRGEKRKSGINGRERGRVRKEMVREK